MRKISGVALTLVLALAAVAASPPPRFTLEGRIRDRELHTPVAGANVALVVSGRSVATEDDGTFTFGERPVTGADQLVISHPDYQTVRIPLGDLGANPWHLEITLVRKMEVLGGSEPGGGGNR